MKDPIEQLIDAIKAKEIILQTITLMNGDKCDIITPMALHVSRALYRHSKQNHFEATIYFAQELCKINGQQKDINYFLELTIDDYLAISDVLTAGLSRVFNR